MELNIDQIEALLPHRYPFLLVDKIVECTPGQGAKGIKCVTANEPFFQGHFPGYKVMPGVLIIEALAGVSRTPASSSRSAPAMCWSWSARSPPSGGRWALALPRPGSTERPPARRS